MIAADIREKLKQAMRDKDQVKLDTLRGVLSAIIYEKVAPNADSGEPSDEAVLKIIAKLVKQRKDAIEQFEKGGRTDLADIEQQQLAVLEAYLPEQMSEDAIRKIAQEKKDELGITDKTKAGILTGAVMKAVAGQADGSVVKSVVESLF